MLRSFFESGTDPSLFAGLEIAGERELCERHMGKYPVLSVSLKDVAGGDYETARESLGILLSELAGRFAFLMPPQRPEASDTSALQVLRDKSNRPDR